MKARTYVYFIHADNTDFIKIGIGRNPNFVQYWMKSQSFSETLRGIAPKQGIAQSLVFMRVLAAFLGKLTN